METLTDLEMPIDRPTLTPWSKTTRTRPPAQCFRPAASAPDPSTPANNTQGWAAPARSAESAAATPAPAANLCSPRTAAAAAKAAPAAASLPRSSWTTGRSYWPGQPEMTVGSSLAARGPVTVFTTSFIPLRERERIQRFVLYNGHRKRGFLFIQSENSFTRTFH